MQGDPGQYTERLFGFANERGIAVEFSSDLGQASGMSTGGKILLKPGLAPAEAFAVLSHELAHEQLHHRSDRERTNKCVRETEAEAVAYVVTHAVGLDPNTAAVDYIQLYQGNKSTLVESLHSIQTTAAEILNFVLPNDASQSS